MAAGMEDEGGGAGWRQGRGQVTVAWLVGGEAGGPVGRCLSDGAVEYD